MCESDSRKGEGQGGGLHTARQSLRRCRPQAVAPAALLAHRTRPGCFSREQRARSSTPPEHLRPSACRAWFRRGDDFNAGGRFPD